METKTSRAARSVLAGLLVLAAATRAAAQAPPDSPTGITLGLSGPEPAYWTDDDRLQLRWQHITWPPGTETFPRRYRIDLLRGRLVVHTMYAPGPAGTTAPFLARIDETVPTLTSGTYTVEITSGYFVQPDLTLVESATPAARDFRVDVVAPSASLSPLASSQSSPTFGVSWSGTDDASGIASYDLQYKTQGGAWKAWLSATTQTGASFTGSNGETYTFRVRARDKAGNVGAYSAATVATTVSAAGAALAVTMSPSLLSFASGERSKSVSLAVKATGTGPVQLTMLTERRTYADGSMETLPAVALASTVPAGGTVTLERTVSLDALQRAHALGSSTQGTFTLSWEVAGKDALAAQLKASTANLVSVSGGLPGGLAVTGVSLVLPPGPWYVGDVVQGALIKIQATGSGVVAGQVKVDGSATWSASPGFSVPVNGDTIFAIQGSLPTTQAGGHTITVELLSPALSTQAPYTVAENPSGFPPTSLTLVPGAAVLTQLAIAGPVTLDSYPQYDEYRFSAKATLQLVSLASAVPDAAVDDLAVRYYKSAPTVPVVAGGEVSREAQGAAPLLVAAGGSLKVRAVRFQGDAGGQHKLTVDAAVSLPQLAQGDLFVLEGLEVSAAGIEDGSFAWGKSEAVEIAAFGFTWSIHQPAGSAWAVRLRKEGQKQAFDLAGSLLLAVAGAGGSGGSALVELTQFGALTLYSDGTAAPGSVAFASPYVVLPGALSFEAFEMLSTPAGLRLGLSGKIASLAQPLDKLGERGFQALFHPDGSLDAPPAAVLETHALGGGDATEWPVGLGTLDVTWLAPQLAFGGGLFHPEQSAVRAAVDLYLDVTTTSGAPVSPADRRLSFGEPGAAGSQGILIGSGGKASWYPLAQAQAAKLQGKVLSVASTPLTVSIGALAVQTAPFRLVLNGEILLGAAGVTGGVAYTGLKLGLDGSLDSFAVEQSDLLLAGVLKVRVEDLEWSGKPGTLVINEPAPAAGGPPTQAVQSSVAVASSYKLTGPSLAFVAGGVTLAGGGYASLTVYQPQSGPRGFFLQGADLSALAGAVEVKGDLKNRTDGLGLAGTVQVAEIPQVVTALGALGQHNGAPYFGVFLSASGLNVPLAPGVFLNEIGGGVFVNPEPQDVAWVKAAAGFSRPDLDDLVSAKLPAGSSKFAIALLGGMYLASPDAVKGRALVTITAKTFELAAQVEAAAGILQGRADLAVGWNPAYALGSASLSLSFVSAVEGSAQMELYVFDSSKWGIFGGGNLSLFGKSMSKVDFFLGPPGFTLTGGASYGIDLYVLSGSVSFSATIWYYTPSEPDNAGAYVTASASGDFLDDLFSASASLRGALIIGSDVFVYAVGHVEAEVCDVEVYDGSVWVSVGTNGLHGGTGSNSDYDALIAQANQMAADMKAMKQQLLDELDKALARLAALSDEQLTAAGVALVARAAADWDQAAFAAAELYWWGQAKYPSSLAPSQIAQLVLQNKDLPPQLQLVYDTIFGSQGSALAAKRAALQKLMDDLGYGQADLEARQAQLAQRLQDYQELLNLHLPSIQELGSLANPMKGVAKETLVLGTQTLTVPVSFGLDAAQAAAQAQQVASVQQQFQAYQGAFIEQAGIIDARLAQLEEILSSGPDSLTAVLEGFAYQYSRTAGFIDDYTGFHGEYIDYAMASLFKLALGQSDAQIEALLEASAKNVQEETLSQWGMSRRGYMDILIALGGSDAGSVPSKAFQGSGPELFKVTGMDLWRNVPLAGFKKGIEISKQQRVLALEAFEESRPQLRFDWSQAAATADKYFQKKADLYGVLYEIYDQLAAYGTGEIAVASDGNAAGFSALASAGLAFRSSAVAKAVLGQAVQSSPGQPGAPAKAVQIFGSGTPKGGQKLASQPFLKIPGAGSGSPGGPVPLGASSLGLGSAVFDKNVTDLLAAPAKSATALVPVSKYFAAKRAEVEPYLAIPSFAALSGQVSSATKYGARLELSFGASHPVGVVEYAYRIEPQPPPGSGVLKAGSQTWLINEVQLPVGAVPFVGQDALLQLTLPSGSALQGFLQAQMAGQKGDYTDAYVGAQPGIESLLIQLPWFSTGRRTQVTDVFIPDLDKQGVYRLIARARGAGGRTITRTGTFTLKYHSAKGGGGPVASQVDFGDATPPPKPKVHVERAWVMTGAAIQASWAADDPQSGIQKYEYRVVEHQPPLGLGTAVGLQILLGNLPGGGSQAPKKKPMTIELLGAGPAGGSSWLTQGAQPPASASANLGWRAAGGLTEANIRDVALTSGRTYVVEVRATNGVGLASTGASEPFVADGTPPSAPVITAFVQATVNGSPASVKFSFQPGQDPESGIDGYAFALGTAAGKDDIVPWTPLAGAGGSVAALAIPSGTITLTVRASNRAGSQASASKSLVFAAAGGSAP